MPVDQLIENIEEKKAKTKPLFLFLLCFGYFMVWFFAYNFYAKYEMKNLEPILIGITLLTLLTFGYGILIMLKDRINKYNESD